MQMASLTTHCHPATVTTGSTSEQGLMCVQTPCSNGSGNLAMSMPERTACTGGFPRARVLPAPSDGSLDPMQSARCHAEDPSRHALQNDTPAAAIGQRRESERPLSGGQEVVFHHLVVRIDSLGHLLCGAHAGQYLPRVRVCQRWAGCGMTQCNHMYAGMGIQAKHLPCFQGSSGTLRALPYLQPCISWEMQQGGKLQPLAVLPQPYQ